MAAQDNFSGLYQSLAATDKKKRDKAFRKLRSFLVAKEDLDEGTALKIWKALFYCMYMCDKVGPQQQLAEDISQIAVRLRRDEAGADGKTAGPQSPKYDAKSFARSMLFVNTFFATIIREFPGIDQHRKDKYLSLIRKMVHGALVLVKSHAWHPTAVAAFNDLMETVLQVNGKQVPGVLRVTADVRLQVVDVFNTELKRATTDAGDPLPATKLARLLEPFLVAACAGHHRPTITRIVDNVLLALVNSLEDFPEANVSLLRERIFDAASADSTRDCNRRAMFRVHKQLKRNLRGLTIGRGGRIVPHTFNEIGEPSAPEDSGDEDDGEEANADESAIEAAISASLNAKLAVTAAAAEAPTPKSGVRPAKKKKKKRKANEMAQRLVIEGVDDDSDRETIEADPSLKPPSQKELKRAQKKLAKQRQQALDEEREAEEAAASRREGRTSTSKQVRFALKKNKVCAVACRSRGVCVTGRVFHNVLPLQEVSVKKITKRLIKNGRKGTDLQPSPSKSAIKPSSPDAAAKEAAEKKARRLKHEV